MILITKCEGAQLEKSSPASPEDSFVRSMVRFEADGREKTFHLVYLRFFEDDMAAYTPFSGDPLYTVGRREVMFKDIAAFAAFIQHPEFQNRKRVYVTDREKFTPLFQNLDYAKVKSLFETIESKGAYEFKSSIVFLKQPKTSLETRF